MAAFSKNDLLQAAVQIEENGEKFYRAAALEVERFDLKSLFVDLAEQEIKHKEDRCTSCTACVPICPTGALDVDRECWLVSYDAEKCVVCLSCVEVCPYKAIDIHLH